MQSIVPDLVAEDATDLVALLMVWKETNDRSFKRARLEKVQHVMSCTCPFRHQPIQCRLSSGD